MPSVTEKVKAANPFAKIGEVLVPPTTATPGTPATPAAPTKAVAGPSGPGMQVDWADPDTGKRMSGTAAERDASLKKPDKPKSPAGARSMSKR